MLRNEIITAVVVAAAGYLLLMPLTLLYLSCLLAFLLYPVQQQLKRITHHDGLASLLALVFFVCIIYFSVIVFIPALYNQLILFSSKLNQLRFTLPSILNKYVAVEVVNQYKSTLQKTLTSNIDQIASYLFNVISAQGLSLVMFGGRFYLVLIMSFYALKDFNKFQRFLLPTPNDAATLTFIKNSLLNLLASLKKLFQGQLLIIIISTVNYIVLFALAGLPSSIVIGILAGISSLIPYLGTLVTSAFIGLYVLNTAPSVFNFSALSIILITYNMFESSILSPYLLGSKLKIHPLLWIFYMLCFGALFGIPGIMLALPNAVVAHTFMKTILQHLQQKQSGKQKVK